MQMTNVTTEKLRNGAREIASLKDVATPASPRCFAQRATRTGGREARTAS